MIPLMLHVPYTPLPPAVNRQTPVHKGRVFHMRQVNHKELESLRFACPMYFNISDVILDTKQKHDPTLF